MISIASRKTVQSKRQAAALKLANAKLERFKQMDRLGVRYKETDEVIAVLCREIADLRDKVAELSARLPSTDQE